MVELTMPAIRKRFSPRKETQPALARAAGDAMLAQQAACLTADAMAQAAWAAAVDPFVALAQFKSPAATRKRKANAAKLERLQAELLSIVGERVYKYWRTR
jgi:hypothetical protein